MKNYCLKNPMKIYTIVIVLEIVLLICEHCNVLPRRPFDLDGFYNLDVFIHSIIDVYAQA